MPRLMKRFYTMVFLSVCALTGTAQVTNSGNFKFAPGASVTFFGNMTNNGTLTDSGTVVTLAGSSPQTIDGSSVITFNNLTLNNTSVSGITLNQAMNVRGTLVFTDGYLVTTSSAILGLTATAAVSGAGNASFVSGPVFKTGNQSFVFPVGKNTAYAPISISAPSLATDRFTAEYFQASPDASYSVSNLEAGMDHVSQCEYWTLDRTIGSTDVTVTLSWDTRSCGVTDLSDLRVARWDGAQWTNKGNGGTTGTTSSGTVVSSAPVTGFGPFTLSSVSSSNPLPVEIIDFTAECNGNGVMLGWSTASELNNDFFTVERSTDALNWTPAGKVNAAGNSTTRINYSCSGGLSHPGEGLYFRLKQTDLNGQSDYFGKIIYRESCYSYSSKSEVLVFPNPARNSAAILTDQEVLAITVLNPAGMRVSGAIVYPQEKRIDLTLLPEGIYFLEIATERELVNQRLVVCSTDGKPH